MWPRYFSPRYWARRFWAKRRPAAPPLRTLPVVYSAAWITAEYRWAPPLAPWQVTTMPTLSYDALPEPVEYSEFAGPLTWSADMSTTVQLIAHRGEDVQIPATPKDVPAPNIAGWTIEFRLYRAKGGELLLTRSTATAGVTITDAATGKWTATLTAAQTLALAAGDYWHQSWRVDEGFRTVLVEGEFEVRP